jgi:hypothetical protein
MFAAKEKRTTAMPQDFCRPVKTAMLNSPSNVRPAGSTIIADIMRFIIPPELTTTEGSVLIVFYRENIAGIEQLFDLNFVFNIDLLHLNILREEYSIAIVNSSALIYVRRLISER